MVRAICEFIILGAISVTVAFAWNAINPDGIPLFGQWDPSKGSVHAGGPCAPTSNQTGDLDAMDLYLNSSALFVDARSADEYAQGHIPRAINLPIAEINSRIDEFLETYAPDTRLLLYCSGPDCHDAHDLAKLLEDYGYHQISVYSNGFDKWKNAGRPIERAEGEYHE